MQVTVFTCDSCGSDVDDGEWHARLTGHVDGRIVSARIDLCEACVSKMLRDSPIDIGVWRKR